jgi:hypothetical protein
LAGNSSSTNYSWTANARKSIALYHFNTSPGQLIDSSGFTSPYNSNLVVTGRVDSVSGKFSRAADITSKDYLSSAHNRYTQNLGESTLTVEAFIKLTESLSTSGSTIASKSASANNFGWKFQMKRVSNKNYLTFNASSNGTTWLGATDLLSSSVTLSQSTFTHVVVTFNKGTVTFYVDGVLKGTGTLGTAGSTAIYSSTAPLYIGSFAGAKNAEMTVDEFRMSQILRYTTAFQTPTSAFTGD